MITDEMIAYESGQSLSDRKWDRFVSAVERELGVSSIDGDEDIEGYSLDYAYDAWTSGSTPAQYAAAARARKNSIVVKEAA